MKHEEIAEILEAVASEIFDIAVNMDYYAGFGKQYEYSDALIEKASEIKFLAIDLIKGDLDEGEK